MINERLGNTAVAIMTCNQLAIVARNSGRPHEAEGGYKRALELAERVQPGSPSHATYLNDLANLLVNEAGAGRAAKTPVAETKSYADRALEIRETRDPSAPVWTTLTLHA